jgi:methylated-DNA-[protein]-cysteine S-methyltransferase
MIVYSCVPSPVGDLLLAADPTHLRAIAFLGAPHPRAIDPTWHRGNSPILAVTQRQLEEYFAGQRHHFELPLGPEGTPFQRTVWQQLERIPFGETISYATLASRIGKPAATRAVGAANGRNPIAIVIPCHRVIGADGSLTGFGGGLPIKRALLEREGASRSRDLFERVQPAAQLSG